eukprot:gene16684-18378_t
MALNSRFCDGYLTIKPRKSQKKGLASTPRQATNNVYHVQNAFHKAVENGDITQVKVLLRYAHMNIHLNDINQNGHTALQECCLKDDMEMIRLLVDNGASIEEADCYGWTTLHYAAFFGNLEIVRFLVLNCANLTALNNRNSIDVNKLIEDVDISDSHDTIDTGYEGESPPVSPTASQLTNKLTTRRRFGLVKPNAFGYERKYASSPRKHDKVDNEFNGSLLEIVKEDEFQNKEEEQEDDVFEVGNEEERTRVGEEQNAEEEDDKEKRRKKVERTFENEEDLIKEDGKRDKKIANHKNEEDEIKENHENVDAVKQKENNEGKEARFGKKERKQEINDCYCPERTVGVDKAKFGFVSIYRKPDGNKIKHLDEKRKVAQRPSGIPRLNAQKKEKLQFAKSINKVETSTSKKYTQDKDKLKLISNNFLKIRKVSSEPDVSNIDEQEYFQKPMMRKIANMESLNMIE